MQKTFVVSLLALGIVGCGPADEFEVSTVAQAMTKAELIDNVHKTISGRDKKETAEIVQATFDALSEAVSDGRFSYPGFGTFYKDCKNKGQCKKGDFRFEAGPLISWAVKTKNKGWSKSTLSPKSKAGGKNSDWGDVAKLLKAVYKQTGKLWLSILVVNAVFRSAEQDLKTRDRFAYPDFGTLTTVRTQQANVSRISAVEYDPAPAVVQRKAP